MDPIKGIADFGEMVGRKLGLDGVYDRMADSANKSTQTEYDKLYKEAKAAGKSDMEAGKIATEGASSWGSGVKNTFNAMGDGVFNPGDPMKTLMPLLVGAGVVGAGLLLVNSLSGDSVPVTPRRERLDRDR